MKKNWSVSCLEKDFAEFYSEAKRAKQMTYRSSSGMTYTECPGTYNDNMVRSMAHDALIAHLSIKSKDEKLGTVTQNWMPKLSTHNTEIMRRIDDFKGNRPMKAPMYKKALRLAAEIEDVARSKVASDLHLRDKMMMWADRLLYQNAWEYYLRQKSLISQTILEASTREYDCNDVLIGGLTAEDEQKVKDICELRLRLLNAFIRIPVRSPLQEKCRNSLEMLAGFTSAIMEDWDGDEKVAIPNKENEEISTEFKELKTTIEVVLENIGNELGEHASPEHDVNDMLTAINVLIVRAKSSSKELSAKYIASLEPLLRKTADKIKASKA